MKTPCLQIFSNRTERYFQHSVNQTSVADMDEVITRIVEIERQCSADVEQAELEYGKKIEDHKRILEEKKTRERALILSQENTRLTHAIDDSKRQIDAASGDFKRNSERIIQDQVLNNVIKEDIISILLAS